MLSRTRLCSRARAQVAVGFLWLAIAALTIASCGADAGGQVLIPTGTPPTAILHEIEVVRSYDSAADEHPEGIAVDQEGNVYASLARLGQVRKIAPDGTESIYADFGGPKALGLAVDAKGSLYVCMYAPGTETHGVHRIETDGTSRRLPGSEEIVHANGLALDRQGNLYVSDSEAGTLWRVPVRGSAELWLEHALLEGTGETPGYPPIGANGVACWQDLLYVANLEQGIVLRIPVLEGGQAGEPEVVAERLYGMDGIAVDLYGRVYAAQGVQSKVIQIDPVDGTVTDLATRSDGLDVPASLAFGTWENERESLFVSNYAVTRFSSNPGIIRLDLGVQGYPLP